VGDLAHVFQGEYYDAHVELHYHRDRWYSPGLGQFISPDRFVGTIRSTKSLHRYAFAFGDPANFRDPSGLIGVGEFSAASSVQGEIRVAQGATAGAAGATASGKAAVVAGTTAENAVLNAIRGCLKPGATIDKAGKIFTKSGLGAVPDFLIKIGDKVAYIEVKTKLPLKSTKEAFERAAKQLQAAIDNETKIFGLSFSKLGDKAFENRTANLLSKLSGDKAAVQFINGFVEVGLFLGEFLRDACL
jgi:RHS repeat-associated protein